MAAAERTLAARRAAAISRTGGSSRATRARPGRGTVRARRGDAERMLGEVLAPMLGRPAEELRSAPLLVGPAELCAEQLAAWAEAGARRIFVWPLRDELAQLERFRERVVG